VVVVDATAQSARVVAKGKTFQPFQMFAIKARAYFKGAPFTLLQSNGVLATDKHSSLLCFGSHV